METEHLVLSLVCGTQFLSMGSICSTVSGVKFTSICVGTITILDRASWVDSKSKCLESDLPFLLTSSSAHWLEVQAHYPTSTYRFARCRRRCSRRCRWLRPSKSSSLRETSRMTPIQIRSEVLNNNWSWIRHWFLILRDVLYFSSIYFIASGQPRCGSIPNSRGKTMGASSGQEGGGGHLSSYWIG